MALRYAGLQVFLLICHHHTGIVLTVEVYGLQAEQLAEAGLSASHIAATVLSVLGKKKMGSFSC